MGDFIKTNAPFPDSIRWFVYLAHRYSYEAILSISGHFVYIFHMAPKISTLCESLIAQRASVGSLACVLPKVVTQVAALLKDTFAACVLALKIEFDALSDFVLYLNCLVPIIRHSLECL